MGTTADKLQAVLSSKNAIKEKFNLPGDMPFSQYAENIKGGQDVTLGVVDAEGKFQPLAFEGTTASNYGESENVVNYHSWNSTLPTPEMSGTTDFYKCAAVAGGGGEETPSLPPNTWSGYKAILVEETVITEGETVLIVSGSGIADGTYKLMDSTATGTSRVWKHTDSEWYFVWTGSMWVINTSPTYSMGQEKFYPDSTGDENPWEITTWWGDDGIVEMSITQQTTEGSSELKKYYEFAETLTEGLTFGNGFTPVVDKVYDSEAMIRASLSEKNKYPEIASPMDMTGYTKDDWVVSESDYRFDSTKAWNGFYPNGIWAGDDWLQWQNTAQQVLVRQITFGYGGNSNWIYSCRLDGSDDGNTWTEIGTHDCEYDDEHNTVLTYPENETAYYYHRLVVLSSNGCAVVYKLLAKRDIDGKNTP